MNRFQWGSEQVQRLAVLVAGYFHAGPSAAAEPASVPDLDREIEQSFRSETAQRFPEDVVLGEEIDEAHHWVDGGWILDPIDGSTNFQAGFRNFAVSLAYVESGQVQMGWVVDPLTGSTWSAERERGAFRDGELIRVHGDASDPCSLVAVSSWFRRKYPEPSRVLSKRFKDRSMGSVALEMVHVADGTFVGGFWHHVHAWDLAAASLVVEEAGGFVGDFAGRPLSFTGGAELRERKYTFLACSTPALEHLSPIVTPLSPATATEPHAGSQTE